MKQNKDLAASDAVRPEIMTTFDRISVVLYFILMFLSMTVTTGRMTMVMTGLALVLTVAYAWIVGKRSLSVLRQNLSIPVIGFLGFALMTGLAAIYSDFDAYAIGEFYKFLTAFALTAIVLFCFRRCQADGVLWGLSSLSALIGLLGVDAACKGPLFRAFQSWMQTFGIDYTHANEFIQQRLNGLYNDANVTASIMALGCLLALYLLIKEQAAWKRFTAAVLLGVSAMSFYMSVSRGAMGCFALALLVWMIAAGRGKWIRLFLLAVISAVLTIGFSALAMPLFSTESLLPDVYTLLCGPAIFLVDWLVGVRLSRLLEKRIKIAVAVAAVLMLGSVAFAVAAVTISEPCVVAEGQYFVRRVKLEPGQYTVSGDWDGTPEIIVRANSRKEVLLQHNKDIYRGPLAETEFTIPEGTEVVQVLIRAPEGAAELREITFSDGTRLHLGYPLLPDFISVRLQDGMFSGYNFSQRVQYYKDALTLWKQAPLFGHGLGSTEGLYTSIQPYFYQSLYVHNHILQVLCDMGLVGGVFFLTMLLGVGWLLLRRLRAERDGLAAVLLACWVMINTHSLMEINFSIRGYQCFVFPLLICSAALYAPPIKEKLLKWVGIAGAACIWLYMAVFGGLVESHRMVQREAAQFSTTDPNVFMKTAETFIRRDVFVQEQMKLNYVANAVALDDPTYARNMEKYANDLRASGTYTACSGLCRYLFLPMGELEELFACSREGIAQEASTNDTWNLQFDFYRTEVVQIVRPENYEKFISGVLGTKEYLEQYSAEHWEEIQLTEENRKFLELVQSLNEEGLSAQEGFVRLLIQLPSLQAEVTEP